MELKITTLIENQAGRDTRLAFEHGLSLYIEFAGKRLLFDTGQTGAFADNAEKLGIDLSRLDAVILSHGHYDHSGGLARLFPLLSPGTPVCAGKEFFALKYKKLPGGRFQYNGNPFPREIFAPYPVRLSLLEADVTALTPNILLFRNFDQSFPFETPNLRFYTGDASGFHPDLFPDETALGLLTGKGLVFISGCAHPGIVNMLRKAASETKTPICAVIGGTHLVEASKERIQASIDAFRELQIRQIAVSHCTGPRAEAMLQDAFPGQFIRNNTGYVYQL